MSRNFNLNTNIQFGTSLFGVETIYYIQSVNLPGLSLAMIDVNSRHNVLKNKISSSNLTYNPLTLTFICDEEMKVWVELMNNIIKHKDKFMSNDAWLSIKNNDNENIITIRFSNIMIESIGDMTYESTSDNTELTFEVSIVYDSFLIDTGEHIVDVGDR